MPRWDPDAEDRLVSAATALFAERGYDAVTISDITAAAGLTRRSFFRYFPDKREVLFAGSARNTTRITTALRGFAPDASVREAVLGTLAQVGEFLLGDPDVQARRQRLIDSSPELQERERTKLAGIASALAAGLVDRGLSRAQAHMIGGVAAEVFHSAYVASIGDPQAKPFAVELESSLDAVMGILSPGLQR